MKSLERIIIFGIAIVAIIIADFKFTRGYFTLELVYWIKGNQRLEEEKQNSTNVAYTVCRTQNNQYHFEFVNNSLKPQFFMNYRNDKVFQTVPNDFFFRHANRLKINHQNYEFHSAFWGSCGTGVGLTSINSFQKFERDISYSKLLKELGKQDYITNKGSFKDIIYNEDIFSNFDSLILNKNLRVKRTDTLNVQFYLPIISLFENKLSYVVSNEIKVGYLDMIEQFIKNEKQYQDKGY